MQLKVFLINSILGALGLITCIQAVPIEVIYTGDGCNCQKKINYLRDMPPPPVSQDNKPSEHDYKLELPLEAKAKVTYSFDFMVEEPKTITPPPRENWDLYAKIDRVTGNKKDNVATKETPRTCGCYQSVLANRYVPPESSSARFMQNLRHTYNTDDIEPSASSHIIAIFLKPLKTTELGVRKSRNKRDISRIFMRPKKNEKRSERLVKQYNKRLKDVKNTKKTSAVTKKPIRPRTKATTAPAGLRPLQQLSSFLTLRSLRNKRDIKGEYDLIKKEREQMDLTLPEIIQYMPETLDPNFKRNQCHFRCPKKYAIKTKTKTKTAAKVAATSTTTNKSDRPTFTNSNNIKDEQEEKQINNSKNLTQAKRNTGDNGDGFSLVLDGYSSTPSPNFNYESPALIRVLPRTFNIANNPHGLDPVPQQYVRVSQSPFSSAIFDNPSYVKPRDQFTSNDQLDRLIAAIVSKHSDFIEAKSHPNNALVDLSKMQKEQAKYFFTNPMAVPWNNWFAEDH